MSVCLGSVVDLRECPVGRQDLREVVAAWRDGGCEDDWWQEVAVEDGTVFDVNIYDSAVHGHGPDVGMAYCAYRTVELEDGTRDTDVFNVVASGALASLNA